MAMAPNNPFEDPQNGQVPGESPAPKKGKGCLLGCVIAGLVGTFVCCGGGVFLMYAGLGVMGSEFQRALANNPDMAEHIGEIESFEFSFSGTVEEVQKAENQGGQTPLAFDVEGSKGSARVLIVQDPAGGGVGSATLVMPDGTRHAIDLGEGLGADDDLGDLNLDDMIDPGDLDLGDPVAPEASTAPESEPTESEPTESEPTESEPTESEPTESEPTENGPTEN